MLFRSTVDSVKDDVSKNILTTVFNQLMENQRRSEERRVGKSVDLGGRRIIKKKNII